MSASVEIVIDAVAQCLTIPLSCLFLREDRTFVYRQNKDGFEPVDVTTGSDNGIDIVIDAGLAEGDVISLTDLGLL